MLSDAFWGTLATQVPVLLSRVHAWGILRQNTYDNKNPTPFFEPCPTCAAGLEHINISRCNYVTDRGFSTLLLSPLPHLKRIVVRKCPGVTEDGLREIAAAKVRVWWRHPMSPLPPLLLRSIHQGRPQRDRRRQSGCKKTFACGAAEAE